MQANEELIKLILSVSGQDAIEDLQQQLAYTEHSIDQLKQAYQRGEVTTDDFMKAGKRLTDQQAMLQRNIQAATDAMQQQAHAAAGVADVSDSVGAIGHQSGNAAYKLMQLGQTLDDLQYVGEMGLRPIINNVISLDARAGIALIVVQSLVTQLGPKLVAALGESNSALETTDEKLKRLKQTIEDIEKKPFKLGVDLTQLDKARADLADLEERERNREAAGGDATAAAYKGEIAKTVRESLGGEKNLTDVLTAMEKQSGYQHADPKLLEEAASLEDFIKNPLTDDFGRMLRGGEADAQRLAAVRRQIEDSAGEYVKKSIIDPFLAGDERGIGIVKNAVAANPGAFNRPGINGLTGVEAVGALPTNMDEFLRQKAVDREIAATDQEAQGLDAQWKATKAKRAAAAKEREAALKRSQAATEAEDQALDKFVDEQLPAAEKKTEKERQDQARRLDQTRRDNMAVIAGQRKTDQARARAAALDPNAEAVQRITPRASEHLQRSGFTPQQAEAYAPQLAAALLRGADLNIATQQLGGQMLAAIATANARQAQAEAMLRQNQQNMARMRMRMPTTQPVPFTN